MKRFAGIVLLLTGAAAGATLTPAEREKAVRHLDETRAAFVASIQGLTPEQWNFKPGPDVWSVGEVAEHITLSEGAISELVQKKILLSPVNAEQIARAKGNDEKVLEKVVDRSEKAKAPPFLEPKGRWTQQTLPGEFRARRDKTVEFIRTTPEDLRSHTMPDPRFGALDAYQIVLLISAHSARHTAQIEEVKAHPNFPQASAKTLTGSERDKAISHLNETRRAFLESIRGLSAAQWNFKPAPDVWSVGEVAEHITVSEGTILDLIQKKILAGPVDAAQVAQAQGKDDAILRMIPDRSEKFKAPQFLQPAARWNQAELPKEFEARRARTLDFIRSTQDDLRSHTFAHPVMKAIDAYQWVLLLSAHSQRHTEQIREVKGNAGFPKN